MLKNVEIEVLTNRVLDLLATEGMRFESPEMCAIMLKKGCTESPSKRIRIPGALVDELTAYLSKTQDQDREDQELHPILRHRLDPFHHMEQQAERDPGAAEVGFADVGFRLRAHDLL